MVQPQGPKAKFAKPVQQWAKTHPADSDFPISGESLIERLFYNIADDGGIASGPRLERDNVNIGYYKRKNGRIFKGTGQYEQGRTELYKVQDL